MQKKKLLLQLTKCCSMLYRVRDFYERKKFDYLQQYECFCDCLLNYAITGNKTKYERKLKSDKIIQVVQQLGTLFSHVTHLCKKFKCLKLNNIYGLQLSKFMHNLRKEKQSKVFHYVLRNLYASILILSRSQKSCIESRFKRC